MILETFTLITIIELLTIIDRLIFGSVKEKYQKWKFKYKIRIHHGYIGLLLIIINLGYYSKALYIIGLSLFISDAIHHFIVLPLWVGRTEFP